MERKENTAIVYFFNWGKNQAFFPKPYKFSIPTKMRGQLNAGSVVYVQTGVEKKHFLTPVLVAKIKSEKGATKEYKAIKEDPKMALAAFLQSRFQESLGSFNELLQKVEKDKNAK